MKRGFWYQLFMDQAGGLDDKRILGIPTFAAGVLFAIIGGIWALVQGKMDWIGPIVALAGFLTGAGLTILGVAVIGDQGKLLPPDDPKEG